jgi:uncharacterized membrane protein YoaK (UPF0700 family)
MGRLVEGIEEILLCGIAGYADAVGYIVLGSIFAANMTGNTVLLAIAVIDGSRSAMIAHGAALAAFFVGALIGRSVACLGPTRAPTFLVEAALIGLLVAVPLPPLPELAILSAAMGVQASARVRVGEIDLASVVVTTTLVRLAGHLVDLVARPQAADRATGRRAALSYALAWIAYGLGAAAGALALGLMERPLLVPLLLLLPLVVLELVRGRGACGGADPGGMMGNPGRESRS